ncbi:MAG: hypothetical protein ABL912_01945 [Novosphingobium sp.]
MADSDLDLSRLGGRVNADTGMNLTATDVDRIGGMALQTITHLMELMHFDADQGVPITGFPRDVNDRDHCIVTATSDLGYSVATGFGMLYDSAATVDEFGPARYLPIVVDVPLTGSLAAHNGQPRWDIVCLAPAYVSDQSASRNVKNPSTGVTSVASIGQRTRFSAAIQVVTGTASATPSPPSVPAGHVEIGRALVPATSGAATWHDSRPVLELGALYKSIPAHACADFVPLGDSGELEVVAQSPAAMRVDVRRGRAVIHGTMRGYPTTTLTVAAADAALDRIDLVKVGSNGTVGIETGTPAATPSAPAPGGNAIALAEILVPASTTTVISGRITDLRVREPYHGTTHLQAGTTHFDRLDTPAVGCVVLAGTQTNTNTHTFTVQPVWPNGDDHSTPVSAKFCAEVLDVVNDTTTATDYDEGSGQDLRKYLGPDIGTDPDYVLKPVSNITMESVDSAVDFFAPRMYFTVTDPTAQAHLEVRRRNTSVHGGTGSVIVHVWPMGDPINTGPSPAAMVGPTNRVTLNFT